jgi:hypothetical protein
MRVLGPHFTANDKRIVNTSPLWQRLPPHGPRPRDVISGPGRGTLQEPDATARPADDKVVDVVRTWLGRNPNHPQAHQTLCTLITRSGGAEEWMQKGEQAHLNAAGGRNVVCWSRYLPEARPINTTLSLRSMRSKVNPISETRHFYFVRSDALSPTMSRTHCHFWKVKQHPITSAWQRKLWRARFENIREVPGDVLNGILRRWLNDHQYRTGYNAEGVETASRAVAGS